MSFYDDASLVVIPSGFKTSKVYAEKPTDGSGDLTFTRTGDTATRVGPDGLIQEVRTNRVLQSQTLSVSPTWTPYSGTTVTADAIAAPDGTLTADRIAGTSAAFRGIFQTISSSAVPHTFSVYLKSATGSATTARIWVDSGVSLVNVTTDWQRFSVTATTAASFQVQISTAVSSAIDVYAWGAQLETSDVATAYIPTTTAAVSVGPVANLPRLDYLNSSCPRLILEPQRSNLVTNSERFTSWISAGGTVTSNTAISPDGYLNADTLTGARYQSGFAINQYTVSCFAKKVDGDGMFVLRLDAPTLFSAQFNLNTGAIVSTSAGYTSTITNYGNGWYRCTLTTPVSTTITNFVLVSATSSTASTYIWGAQCEVGAYATSYIPTLAAAATRGADVCSKTGISSLIGQTEGTLFVDAVLTHSAGATNEYLAQVNASANNRVLIYRQNSTNKLGAILISGGTVIYSVLTSGAITSTAKVAFAYKSGDFAFYVNGTQVGTSSATYATPPSMGSFDLDSNGGTENGFYSYNQALLFKTRLTNAELATLTTL